MTPVKCSSHIIDASLTALRKGVSARTERVLLWLGRDQPGAYRVLEVYEPEQETGIDYFRIPPESMRSLMGHLRKSRQKIVAQIHTHPGRAFHSEADDQWAIIRHVGALSLVLPYFASSTTVDNFHAQVMAYELSTENQWCWIDAARIEVTG